MFVCVCVCVCLVAQLFPTLCDPMDYSPPGSSVHGDSPGKNIGVGPCPPPGDLPNPGIKPRSPTLQVDSLPTEPPRKPKCSHPIFLGPSFPQRAPYFRKTELSWMIFKHHQSSATLTIRSAVYGFLLFCCKRREPPCKSNQEGLLNCLSIALISQYPSAGHQYN